ncbi:MAG: NHL repeat-containing protein [Candidatus Acidiferrales bacterium]
MIPGVRRAGSRSARGARKEIDYSPSLRRDASWVMILPLLVCISIASGCSRGETQAGSQADAPPSLQFVGSWGVHGDGPGQLDKPACIAIDALGNAYIADAGSQFIHKFDSRGTPLLSFQETFFENPDSIAVDDGGAIYVADSVRGVVWIFLPSGERYRPLRLPRHTGAEYPLSVTVGDDGLIDVLDTGTDKVFTYNPRLRFLHSWQPAADARDPSSHPSAIAAASDGYFYALDPPANRILRFDSDRRLVSVIDAGAGGMGRKLSGEFAVSEGLIYAMDSNGRTLHVWTTDGKLRLDADLTAELGPGDRGAPPLAAGPRGQLLVLDAPGSRVLRYDLHF